MCNQHTEDKSKDARTCDRYWKWVANAACVLLTVLMMVIGSLILVFAGIYQLLEPDSVLKALGLVLVIGITFVCFALGFLVWKAVCAQGKEYPNSYRENALEIIKLFSALLAIVTALSALLLMFFS